jgi:hypothetical protein
VHCPRLALVLAILVGTAAAPAAAEPPSPSSPSPEKALAAARERLDFGDFEAVVQMLRPVVEAGGAELPWRQDRIEALRAYGIACALTGRRTAAEGAFVLLLDEAPTIRFDPALVRPEAVVLLEIVRARLGRAHAPTLATAPAPPRLPSRTPGIALVATGGALALSALVFVGLAAQARSDYAITSLERAAADAQTRFNVFAGLAISLGAGAVVASGVGIGLWIRATRARRLGQ